MGRPARNILCEKRHVVLPISYRESKHPSSPVRIQNYWYCPICNKVLKIEPPKKSVPKVVFAK